MFWTTGITKTICQAHSRSASQGVFAHRSSQTRLKTDADIWRVHRLIPAPLARSRSLFQRPTQQKPHEAGQVLSKRIQTSHPRRSSKRVGTLCQDPQALFNSQIKGKGQNLGSTYVDPHGRVSPPFLVGLHHQDNASMTHLEAP